MPPQNTHEEINPIFQREIEMFREREREAGRAVYDDQLNGILSALRRASLSVVEESLGKESLGNTYSQNELIKSTLATAKKITGE